MGAIGGGPNIFNYDDDEVIDALDEHLAANIDDDDDEEEKKTVAFDDYQLRCEAFDYFLMHPHKTMDDWLKTATKKWGHVIAQRLKEQFKKSFEDAQELSIILYIYIYIYILYIYIIYIFIYIYIYIYIYSSN